MRLVPRHLQVLHATSGCSKEWFMRRQLPLTQRPANAEELHTRVR